MTNAIFADLSTRTIRGLLLPFNELSRRSVTTEPVMFAKGSVKLPRDPEVVTLNEGHSQFAPVGRALKLTETDRGIEAEFKVANTPEGDDLLLRASDADETKRPRLSAEVADLVRKGKNAVARLTGAAAVPMGAFASAGLFELAEGEEEKVEDAVEDAVAAAAPEVPADTIDQIADAVVARLNQDPEAAPAEDNKEGAFAVTNAKIPAGVATPATPKKDARALFAAIAAKDFDAMKAFSTPESPAMFAIENLQQSGTSTKTSGADTAQVGYLGEIWDGNPYQRRFWDLFDVQPLTSWKAVGWKWDPDNAPEVASYAGNTAEVNSNALDTIPVSVEAQRVAGGNRLDRRYLDFNDQEVVGSYFRKLAEHYKKYTDAQALAAAVTAAGSDLNVSSKTYPYGLAVALAAIVDGALQVITEEATPTFAVVSPELWRDIVLLGRDNVLEYLNAGFGLEEGTVSGFKIKPGSVGTGKVLVGAKQGLQVFELGGSPIRVDAMAVHNGAMDGALYGYYATLDSGLGLSIVDTTDYTEPTPPTTIVTEGA